MDIKNQTEPGNLGTHKTKGGLNIRTEASWGTPRQGKRWISRPSRAWETLGDPKTKGGAGCQSRSEHGQLFSPRLEEVLAITGEPTLRNSGPKPRGCHTTPNQPWEALMLDITFELSLWNPGGPPLQGWAGYQARLSLWNPGGPHLGNPGEAAK